MGGGFSTGPVQRSLAFLKSSVTVFRGSLVAGSWRAHCCLQTRQLPLVDAVRAKQPIASCVFHLFANHACSSTPDSTGFILV